MKKRHFSWVSIITLTLNAANLMFFCLLFAKTTFHLPTDLPVSTTPLYPLQEEYTFQSAGKKEAHGWVVEQYKKVKVTLDPNGKEVSREPEAEVIYLRYWKGK